MSEAWNVFKEAWGETTRNFGGMFKIWLTTMLILTAIGGFVGFNFIGKMMELENSAFSGEDPSGVELSVFLLTIFGLFFAFAFSGLCVNSYRYLVNRTYQPSWVPFQFDWAATLGFFGRSLLLMLIIFIVLIIPFLFIATIIFGVGTGTFNTIGMSILFVLVYFASLMLVYWIAYRLYMSLVANSVGQQMGFGEAWNVTKPQAGMIFSLIFIVLCISFGAAILSNILPILFINMGGLGTFLIVAINIVYLLFSLFFTVFSIVLGAVLFKRYYYTDENVFS